MGFGGSGVCSGAAVGATSTRELGAVMKAAMPRLQGAADGKVVNRIAQDLLAGGA